MYNLIIFDPESAHVKLKCIDFKRVSLLHPVNPVANCFEGMHDPDAACCIHNSCSDRNRRSQRPAANQRADHRNAARRSG